MTEPTTTAVVVSDLHKSFGKIHALRGINLTVQRGEIYGLLGPNGAGKSTLIRSIVGIVPPDAGSIEVLGKQLPDKDIMHRVGYMTQASALYTDLTVWQNVAFFAGLLGHRDKAAIAAAIELVDLTARKDSRVRTLSGGMKQRVSLATTLVHNPDLILLDEPTVGVDPQLRHQFWSHFNDLTAKGVTILVSSHVMDEAERCNRLGFVRHGRVLIEGSAQSIRQAAKTDNLETAFLYFAENDPQSAEVLQ